MLGSLLFPACAASSCCIGGVAHISAFPTECLSSGQSGMILHVPCSLVLYAAITLSPLKLLLSFTAGTVPFHI